MAIRAYGTSTTDHHTWAAQTAYNLLTFIIPTVPNGYCYECTASGVSGSTEPTFPTTPGQIVQDGVMVGDPPEYVNPVTWTCRTLLAPNPLIATIDSRHTGGYAHKDIWIRSTRPFSDGQDEFVVYGSFDGENWRQIDELEAPQNANKSDRHKGLESAYPFVRVEVNSEYVCEIEIVAGE